MSAAAITRPALKLPPLHPACAIFPALTGDAFEALCADLKLNGLLEPVVLVEGKVLDGRNRYRACLAVGVEVRTREWVGECGSPTAYALSVNLNGRRHLADDQRADIATEALPLLEAEAAKRQRAEGAAGAEHGKKGGRGKKKPLGANRPQGVSGNGRAPRSRDIAAAAAGVSARKVQDAKAVRAAAPDLADKVRAGEITLQQAKRELRRRTAPDPEPAGLSPYPPKAARERFEDLMARWPRDHIHLLVTMLETNLAYFRKKCP